LNNRRGASTAAKDLFFKTGEACLKMPLTAGPTSRHEQHQDEINRLFRLSGFGSMCFGIRFFSFGAFCA